MTPLDEETATKIGEFACVPRAGREEFKHGVKRALHSLNNGYHSSSQKTITVEDIVKPLQQIKKKLEDVEKIINKERPAKLFFESGLSEVQFDLDRFFGTNKSIKQALDWAIADARTTLGNKGRPGGIRTRFEAFIYMLISSANASGGAFTINKNRTSRARGGWTGSLIEAVIVLEERRYISLKALLTDKWNGRTLGYTLKRIAARFYSQRQRRTLSTPGKSPKKK